MTFWDVALICLYGQLAIVGSFILLGKFFGQLHLIELKMSGASILYTAGVIAYANVWGGLGFWTAIWYGVVCLLGVSAILAAVLLAIFAISERFGS